MRWPGGDRNRPANASPGPYLVVTSAALRSTLRKNSIRAVVNSSARSSAASTTVLRRDCFGSTGLI